MTATVENLSPAYPVIQVTYAGEVTWSELRSTAHDVLLMARDTGIWRVLTDCTGMTQVPGELDLMNLGEAVGRTNLDASFRQALLWPEDDNARLRFDFWRTVEANQGLQAKAFGHREAALEWLQG